MKTKQLTSFRVQIKKYKYFAVSNETPTIFYSCICIFFHISKMLGTNYFLVLFCSSNFVKLFTSLRFCGHGKHTECFIRLSEFVFVSACIRAFIVFVYYTNCDFVVMSVYITFLLYNYLGEQPNIIKTKITFSHFQKIYMKLSF